MLNVNTGIINEASNLYKQMSEVFLNAILKCNVKKYDISTKL